jgi:hypothetical protein
VPLSPKRNSVRGARVYRRRRGNAPAGTVPWAALAPTLGAHPAPLQLEIHPNLRPEPATLAILARELLGLRAPAPVA